MQLCPSSPRKNELLNQTENPGFTNIQAGILVFGSCSYYEFETEDMVMPKNIKVFVPEDYGDPEKVARMEEARKAGILTREIAEMPDGGRAFLGEVTWQKLQDYARMRSKLPK